MLIARQLLPFLCHYKLLLFQQYRHYFQPVCPIDDHQRHHCLIGLECWKNCCVVWHAISNGYFCFDLVLVKEMDCISLGIAQA
jgi:hypothetical protein